MIKYILYVLVSIFFAFQLLASDVLEKTPPIPHNNPMTKEKIELGKMLYFDPRLSSTNTISCNSCHDVMGSGTDNQSVSTGVHGQKGGRNAPTVWNSAFNFAQFWDGRAATLEDQAKGPIVNPVEMGMKDHDEVVKKVSEIKGYLALFNKVYGTEEITIDRIAQAIAAYERTLTTPDSPYDRYIRGDKKALSPTALRGLQLTQTTGCVACHNGPMFGVAAYMKFPTIPDATYEKKYRLSEDLGRYNVTQKDSDKNFWRVSSWRNVELTAPYFHNGSVKTLDEAVRVMAKVQLGRTLKDAEVKDIVAFLKSLTGKRPKQTKPHLPE